MSREKKNKNQDEHIEEDVTTQEEIEKVEDLTETVEEVDFQKEAEHWKNEYYKAYADMENTRKRMQNEYQTMMNYSIQNIVSDILPILDNFERAIESGNGNEETEKFLKGFEMIHKQLISTLNNHGVEEIPALNEVFDPHVHQAIAMVESDQPSGIVVEVLQKGYKLKDRVIRATLVKVSE